MNLIRLISTALISATVIGAAGRDLRAEYSTNPEKAACVYLVYPEQDVEKVPQAPKGYKPFYLSHYGRHGSRNLLNKKQYDGLANIMFAADSANALTPLGQKVLASVKRAWAIGLDAAGDLTPIGTAQHRNIGERMARNYPTIFAKNANIDARSTIEPRCIVSMASCVGALRSVTPSLNVSVASGNRYTRIINFVHRMRGDTICPRYTEFMANGAWRANVDTLTAHVNPQRLIGKLFSDPVFAANVDTQVFIDGLFRYARGMQNMCPDNNELLSLFTPDELYWLSTADNYIYYVTRGASPLNEKFPQYYAKKLVEDIIVRADSVVSGIGSHAADLRFGHDGDIMAFVPLMGLNGWDKEMLDPNEIAEEWPVFELSPMATNLQFVFYRKAGESDPIVNVRFNERTATLPLTQFAPGFYRWSDVRRMFVDRMNAIPDPCN